MTAPSPAQLQLFEAREAPQTWSVRVSRRARRLSVRVYPGGRVEVVAPLGTSPVVVEKFVGQHRRWIDERIDDFSAARGTLDHSRPSVIELPALGRKYWVDYRDHQGEARCHMEGEGWLTVRGRLSEEREISGALRHWVESVAHLELGRELRTLAEQHQFSFRRVQIRRQRTRWGSCSVSGTISLNMCVLFQSPEVLRYLLIHELSHTRHMNHSRRFWALVESLEPDYRALDRQLSQGWQHVPGWMFE
jgi:predicted metal-dependent hydrolase